ncbi:hypothetical protein FPV67DRAFT_1728782 [Lyophyllum atratum]|nr:hypothetical protein FPV67DRAFT_1728782 [Lyophyllum atratum]
MADYPLVEEEESSTSTAGTASQADDSYRLSIERFNAFDTQISVLCRSRSPSLRRSPTPPPVVPPLELLGEEAQITTNTASFLQPPAQPSPPLPNPLYSFGLPRTQRLASGTAGRDEGRQTDPRRLPHESHSQGEGSRGFADDLPHNDEVWNRDTHDVRSTGARAYQAPWSYWPPSAELEHDNDEDVHPQPLNVRSESPVPAIGELRSPSPLFDDLEELQPTRTRRAKPFDWFGGSIFELGHHAQSHPLPSVFARDLAGWLDNDSANRWFSPSAREESNSSPLPRTTNTSSSDPPSGNNGASSSALLDSYTASRLEALHGIAEALQGIGCVLQESEMTLRPFLMETSSLGENGGSSSSTWSSLRGNPNTEGRASGWRSITGPSTNAGRSEANQDNRESSAVPRWLRLSALSLPSPLEDHMWPWLADSQRKSREEDDSPARVDTQTTSDRYPVAGTSGDDRSIILILICGNDIIRIHSEPSLLHLRSRPYVSQFSTHTHAHSHSLSSVRGDDPPASFSESAYDGRRRIARLGLMQMQRQTRTRTPPTEAPAVPTWIPLSHETNLTQSSPRPRRVSPQLLAEEHERARMRTVAERHVNVPSGFSSAASHNLFDDAVDLDRDRHSRSSSTRIGTATPERFHRPGLRLGQRSHDRFGESMTSAGDQQSMLICEDLMSRAPPNPPEGLRRVTGRPCDQHRHLHVLCKGISIPNLSHWAIPNTIQRFYEARNRLGRSQTQAQSQSPYIPPSIPPLAFEEEDFDGQESDERFQAFLSYYVNPGQGETTQPPSPDDNSPSIAERLDWIYNDDSGRRPRPVARPSNSTSTTASETSTRPSDLHNFLSRRPRMEASRSDNPDDSRQSALRGDEAGFTDALEVLRHDGLSIPRSQELINRYHRSGPSRRTSETTTGEPPAPRTWRRRAREDPYSFDNGEDDAETASNRDADRVRFAAQRRLRRPNFEFGPVSPRGVQESIRMGGARRGRPLGDYMKFISWRNFITYSWGFIFAC